LPELGDQSDSQLFAEDTGNYYRDPMPFSHSDAVVVGNITSGQAYLSNDKRDVYSEFQIIIQEVLKDTLPAALVPVTALPWSGMAAQFACRQGRC
jgi:hypothetical protein